MNESKHERGISTKQAEYPQYYSSATGIVGNISGLFGTTSGTLQQNFNFEINNAEYGITESTKQGSLNFSYDV